MAKHILITLFAAIISFSLAAQKVRVSVMPTQASLYLNSINVGNNKKVNISDPNIGFIAVLRDYASVGLRPFDLRDQGIKEYYAIKMDKLVKPTPEYQSSSIEITQLVDRTGKVEKPPIAYGWSVSEGTDLKDDRFTGALANLMSKWGYDVVQSNKLFSEKSAPSKFGLGGELTWFFKETAGSGYQISLFIKWSLYSVDEGKVVMEKTVGAFSNSGVTTKFNDELIFSLEDGMKALIGDPEFTKIVALKSGKSPVQAFETLSIPKIEAPESVEYKDMINKSMQSTVTVKTNLGHGSGFIVSESGYVITNDHVVRNASKIEVIFNQGFTLNAELVRSEKNRDVALLKIQGSGFKPLPVMLERESSIVGSDVVVVGTPKSIELGQTVTKGIISGERNFEDQAFYQTDVAINPGNSGGPLIHSQSGKVMGIVVSKVQETGVEGLGFAIPIDDCLKSLNVVVE